MLEKLRHLIMHLLEVDEKTAEFILGAASGAMLYVFYLGIIFLGYRWIRQYHLERAYLPDNLRKTLNKVEKE